MAEIVNNTTEHQFEIREDGGLAFLTYALYPGVMDIMHTEVPELLGGRGLAHDLARHALEYAKANKLRVVPTCPFVRHYIMRHKEYQPLLQS